MNRRAFAMGLAALAALAGCSPPATQYRLEAAPGTVLSQSGLAVGVRGVGIPTYLDQNGIPELGGGVKFATYPNDEWAGALADQLQGTMVQDLAQRLPGAVIVASGGAVGAPSTETVEMNVLRFDADPDGEINLTVQISVRGAGSRRTSLNVWRAAPATGDPAGIVTAMSQLWGRAADQVAAMLVTAGADGG